MARVVKHASTHRFRWLGGTDPVDFMLPFALAGNSEGNSITADTEIPLGVSTNDPDTFRWDSDDPAGVLIIRSGLYVANAFVKTPSSNQTVPRGLHILRAPLSAGPLSGSGSDFTSAYSPSNETRMAPASMRTVGFGALFPYCW